MEAFSDGVIAILITLMVCNIKTPRGVDAAALLSVTPALLASRLSFVYVAIYWNNHHRLLQSTGIVSCGGCSGPTLTCCPGWRWS